MDAGGLRDRLVSTYLQLQMLYGDSIYCGGMPLNAAYVLYLHPCARHWISASQLENFRIYALASSSGSSTNSYNAFVWIVHQSNQSMLLSSNRKHCIFIEMDYHSPPTLYRKILSLNFPPVALQSCKAVCFSTPYYKYVFSSWEPSNITHGIQPNSSQHDSNEGPLPIVVIYTPLWLIQISIDRPIVWHTPMVRRPFRWVLRSWRWMRVRSGCGIRGVRVV